MYTGHATRWEYSILLWFSAYPGLVDSTAVSRANAHVSELPHASPHIPSAAEISQSTMLDVYYVAIAASISSRDLPLVSIS